MYKCIYECPYKNPDKRCMFTGCRVKELWDKCSDKPICKCSIPVGHIYNDYYTIIEEGIDDYYDL